MRACACSLRLVLTRIPKRQHSAQVDPTLCKSTHFPPPHALSSFAVLRSLSVHLHHPPLLLPPMFITSSVCRLTPLLSPLSSFQADRSRQEVCVLSSVFSVLLCCCHLSVFFIFYYYHLLKISPPHKLVIFSRAADYDPHPNLCFCVKS